MKQTILLSFCFLSYFQLTAQYTVNGNASRESCNCYTLTQNQVTQRGSVWNNNRIDLTQSFAFTFDVFLGCSDGGADGIAFVMQPISTSVGGNGSGMGFGGITPSVGVTLDTYQNSGSPDNDPAYDHIAIQLNGDVNHLSANTLTPLTPISFTNNNVEDCQMHLLRIVWDAPTTTMTVFFDGVQRVSTVRNFVSTVFGGNSQVFWGFTGATGALTNLQRFCTTLLPKFRFLPTQTKCVGQPIPFFDSTITFGGILKRYWNFGDGSPIDSVNMDPVHTYTSAGDYTVTVTILALDSCSATYTQTIRVGSKPIPGFTFSDSCVGNNIQFTDTSRSGFGTVNNWYWNFGTDFATIQNPTVLFSTPGQYNIKLAVKTTEGCLSDTLYKTIRILARPSADFTFTDSLCLGAPNIFRDNSSLSGGPVTAWIWQVDNVTTTNNTPILNHTFLTAGNHTVSLSTSGTGGANCFSPVIIKNVFVTDKPRAALKRVTGCEGLPIQLLDSSYTTDNLTITSWWWDLGNGQISTQQNPTASFPVPGPINIKLVVRNSKNCESDTLRATINIAAKPTAKFGFTNPLCSSGLIQFSDSSTVINGTMNQWQWMSNSAVFSTLPNPAFSFPAGLNTVSLSVTSTAGCKSDTVYKTFNIKTNPQVSMVFKDTCKFSEVLFTAAETSAIGIASWHWDFGDGQTSTLNPATHVYTSNGAYTVKLYGISTEACSSDTLQRAINIYGTDAFAGNDTIAAPNQPLQLTATGGISYEWTPPTGLSATNIANPIAINNMDRYYYLKAYTPGGCESYDTVLIKIYKGPEIYVPGAFTPNGDGTNDILHAIPVGISSFEYFAVYNRYGELVFKTSDYRRGWDGRVKGKEQHTGTFVWMVAAVDFLGKKMFKKGSVLLIK